MPPTQSKYHLWQHECQLQISLFTSIWKESEHFLYIKRNSLHRCIPNCFIYEFSMYLFPVSHIDIFNILCLFEVPLSPMLFLLFLLSIDMIFCCRWISALNQVAATASRVGFYFDIFIHFSWNNKIMIVFFYFDRLLDCFLVFSVNLFAYIYNIVNSSRLHTLFKLKVWN